MEVLPDKNKSRFSLLLNWQMWVFILASGALIAFSFFTWQQYLGRDIAADKPVQLFSQKEIAPAPSAEKNISDKLLLARLLDAAPYEDLLVQLKKILPEQDYNALAPYAAGVANEARLQNIYLNWRLSFWQQAKTEQGIKPAPPHPALVWLERASGGRIYLRPRARLAPPLAQEQWLRSLDKAVAGRDYANALNIAAARPQDEGAAEGEEQDIILQDWQNQTALYLRLAPIVKKLKIRAAND